MNAYWHISWRHVRSALVAGLTLTVVLLATGCDAATFGERLRTVTPMAEVEVTPNVFCPGEILTVTWDGGGQIADCGRSPECKGGALYGFMGFNRGFEEFNLGGTAEGTPSTPGGPTPWLFDYSYVVDWTGWRGYRAYRQEMDFGEGPVVTGVVGDNALATFYPGGMRAAPVYHFTCDEETHTWRFEPRDGETRLIRSEEERVYHAIPATQVGNLSACVATTQICIPEELANKAMVLSVEGGPSVTLGGSDNPVCTDAFAGYHPLDVQIRPENNQLGGLYWPGWGEPCTPGEEHPWFGQSRLMFSLAGSTSCATGPGPDGSYFTEDDSAALGEVELIGQSRERCLAALDSAYLARLTAVPTSLTLEEGVIPECGDGTLSIGEQCEQDSDCGGGLVCGDPGTDTACSCSPASLGRPLPQPPPPSGDIALPGSDGSLCGDGVCQAGESPDWCGDCVPEEGGDGGDEGDGGDGVPPPPPPPAPVCGDGVCDPSEVGCGVCSTDCGPC